MVLAPEDNHNWDMTSGVVAFLGGEKQRTTQVSSYPKYVRAVLMASRFCGQKYDTVGPM